MLKNWVFSIAAHCFLILAVLVTLGAQKQTGSKKDLQVLLPESSVLEAVAVSSEEVYAEVAALEAQEEAYYLAKEQKKQQYQETLDRLKLSQKKAETELKQLQDKKQNLKKESQQLIQALERDTKSKKQLQNDLKEKQKELARLEKIQEISEEVRQEKIKTDQFYLESYRTKIATHLSRHWNIPVGNHQTHLRCLLQVSILPNGDVLKVNIIQGSSDPHFDQCAVAAVNKASPLPVLDELEPRLRPRVLNLTFIPGKVDALERLD